MFHSCTSLTSAPSLPATELGFYCYDSMFYGCTSLNSLPELPATKLADGCYNGMFCDCTGIFLSDEKGDFNGIAYEKEYRIPSAGTGTARVKSVDYMFSGTGGRFKETPDINKTYYLGTKYASVSAKNVSVTYDGKAHGITVNVIDPAGEYTVMYGESEGNYNQNESPTITNVGGLTVYCKVTVDDTVT